MKMYTVRDDAAQYFMPPFFCQNDNVAQRMFISSMGDQFNHRVDYLLFCLGSWDDQSAVISLEEPPRLVVCGSSVSDSMDPRRFQEAPMKGMTQ